jgi:L-alanine-DL-glutamate epimerase-like enolase superfamily enzyme
MRLTAEVVELYASHGEFKIARATLRQFPTVIVRIAHEGHVGIGEARPSPYYDNETAEVVIATLTKAAKLLGDDPFQIEDIVGRVGEAFPQAHASVAGIDIALHDLVGKMLGVPVYKLLGLNAARTPLCSFTVGIAEPAVMAQRAADIEPYKTLKVKIGLDNDEAVLSAIREVTDVPIRVDANIGWKPEQAVRMINRIERFGLEFVEQPIPPGDNEALRFIRERVNVPIMADESSVTLGDLPGLIGCVDAINVKIGKCGGLRRAMEMIHFARAAGMKVMLGCFPETSVAVTAAATLSPLVDYSDLDGNVLISNDPFEGAIIRDGRHVLPDEPGFGIKPRPVA